MRFSKILTTALLGVGLCVTQVAAEDMNIGFVYVSPIGDAGWSYAHDQGRLELEKMDGVTTSYVEAVAEGPDSERVMLNMARKGYDVIFATSFGYMDPMLKVAKQFPETIFMHCSGFKTADNMGNYFGRMYQARYLSGMVAGAMTKSNTLGYVAAFPIPEVIRGINAFTIGLKKGLDEIGAEYEEDKLNTVVWLKSWRDAANETTLAETLIARKHDLIRQMADTPDSAAAACAAGVPAIGYGEENPITSNDTKEGRAKNRRVEFTIRAWSKTRFAGGQNGIDDIQLAEETDQRRDAGGDHRHFERTNTWYF